MGSDSKKSMLKRSSEFSSGLVARCTPARASALRYAKKLLKTTKDSSRQKARWMKGPGLSFYCQGRAESPKGLSLPGMLPVKLKLDTLKVEVSPTFDFP